jgi:hypothetical protein
MRSPRKQPGKQPPFPPGLAVFGGEFAAKEFGVAGEMATPRPPEPAPPPPEPFRPPPPDREAEARERAALERALEREARERERDEGEQESYPVRPKRRETDT